MRAVVLCYHTPFTAATYQILVVERLGSGQYKRAAVDRASGIMQVRTGRAIVVRLSW